MAANKVPVYSLSGLSPLDLHICDALHIHEKLGFYKRHRLMNSCPADLKSTSDDALLPYLANLPAPYTFTPNHYKSNVRFLLGYSAVAIAGFTFYADRYLGWEAVRSPWLIAAVVTYFILNSLLTVWVWKVEAGEVFNGTRKTGETVRIVVSFFILQIIMPVSLCFEEKGIV